MASHQDFGTTLKVDNPGDAWFRRARGPATRRLQKVDICQAFTIAAFTSSCQASLCLGPPRHCCRQPPHDVENCTFYVLLLALGSILANFSSFIPVFLAWHCVFHAPTSFDATGKSLLQWRLALAQEAMRGTSLRPFFPCGFLASWSCVLVVSMP